MEIGEAQQVRKTRSLRIGPDLRPLIASLFGVGLLIITVMTAQAGRIRNSGQGGCGLFVDAVAQAEDEDTVTPMEDARPSGGVVISKSITIQGGWTPPDSGCSEPNQAFETEQEMLDAGYQFNAPAVRSQLEHEGGPVLQVDAAISTLTVSDIRFVNTGDSVDKGAGIYGVLDGGDHLLLRNVEIKDGEAIEGGGLYLELRGGSLLEIMDSEFSNNAGAIGGGFTVKVYEDSRVVIRDSKIENNSASVGGGGANILIVDGEVELRNVVFNGNSSDGSGGALRVDGTQSGRLNAFGVTVDGKPIAASDAVAAEGDANVFFSHVYVPLTVFGSASAPSYRSEIVDIGVENGTYVVTFSTEGFTPQLPGRHLHFYFDTVAEVDAGRLGAGPWKIYGQSIPFRGYTVAQRPPGATALCVRVANPDHSILAGTGNCFPLP